MLIDIIAAGIEADTVIPANKPKYVFADDSITENKIPNMIDLIVSSLFLVLINFNKDY